MDRRVCVGISLNVLIQIGSLAWSQNSAVRWSAFDMGFAMPASSTTAAQSVIGQPLVGIAQGANTRIASGFLTPFPGLVLSINEQPALPLSYGLSQNYPNPFNPTTTIQFELPEWTTVTLIIYNLLGQEVALLINEEKPAGVYKLRFDALNLSSGVYFYTLRAGNFVQTKKLIVLK